jgi:hypothetical protein
MVKDKITVEEARRILGSLANRSQDEQLQGIVNNTPTDALDKLLSDAFQARFDVVVTSEPWDPSGKIAAQRALSDLFQSAPPPPVPQLIIGYHEMLTKLAIESGSLPPSIGQDWLDKLQAAEQAMSQPPPGAMPPGGPPPGGPPGAPPGLPPGLAGPPQ